MKAQQQLLRKEEEEEGGGAEGEIVEHFKVGLRLSGCVGPQSVANATPMPYLLPRLPIGIPVEGCIAPILVILGRTPSRS